MTENSNKKMTVANFWNMISEKAQAAALSGNRPILILDLDGTVVDYTGRTYMIFQKAIEDLGLPDDINRLVNSIKAEDYDYYPRSNFIRIGIKDEKIVKKLTDFWDKNYFTNHYLKYDKQMPGAHEFVENILSLSMDVVYLTGRDDQNMGEGTRAWLYENKLLKRGDERCRLMMKMDLEIENFESKALNGERIGAQGQPILIIDNEPIELQTMSERFPEAFIVLVDMPNSGKPATLPDDILKIKDFRELNSLYKK